MQQAADAAAIAGDREIYSGNGSDSNLTPVQNAALSDAAQNGFINGKNNASVTVNAPPSVGAYQGDQTAVEIIVTQPKPTFFLRIFNISSVAVAARAVARYSVSQGCVYTLNPTAQNSLVVSGGSKLNTQCNIDVNSDNTQGLVASGGSTITATDATINVVADGYSGGSAVSPPPTLNASAATNPFASLSFPSVGGCNCTGGYTVQKSQAACDGNTINAAGTSATLNPGVYCGGITVSGNGVSANFNQGMYILNGGGLNVKGGANVTGTGVTFFNTGTANGANQYKPIVVSGGSSTSLTAPTTDGTYEGILFFQDPGICSVVQGACDSEWADEWTAKYSIGRQHVFVHRSALLPKHAAGLFWRKCGY